MAKKKAVAPTAASAAGNGQAAPKIRSNTVQAVKDCLDKGIESPTQIVATLKGQGIEATPNYVSVIKGEYRKGGTKKGKKRGPTPKAATQPAAAQSTASPVKRASTSGTCLGPQDLAGLAELAKRAGGAERLREYLEVLAKVR